MHDSGNENDTKVFDFEILKTKTCFRMSVKITEEIKVQSYFSNEVMLCIFCTKKYYLNLEINILKD
jgi:hypothetical protein